MTGCTSATCTYPHCDCVEWGTRIDIIGQNGNDGGHYNQAPGQHDATRRPQSRFAAGVLPFFMVDDPAYKEKQQTQGLPTDLPTPSVVGDMVNHPPHYTSHPSGVECITITEHMTFCVGNAIKYLWRAGLKGKSDIEDLKKAAWYINREIKRRETQ